MSLLEQVTKDLKMRSDSQNILIVSETALRPLWDTPEEDEAWKHL
jgi:hypothetical protein